MTARRIAYVVTHPPFPANFGAALRSAAMLRALDALGDVHLVVLGARPALAARRLLRARGATIHPPRRETPLARVTRILGAVVTRRGITTAHFLSPRRTARIVDELSRFAPDTIVVGHEALAVLVPALRPLGARIVLDTHNAASRGHLRVARASANPLTAASWALLAWDTRALERRYFPLADAIWAVSEDDAAFYRALVGRPVDVVPNVVELPPALDVREEPGAVAFAGHFAYVPNEDAALRLVAATRALRDRGAVRKLYLVGLAPTERMRRAARGRPEIVITGEVPDVRPWVARAEVAAIPLAAGSGTKLKVIEAMALGRPVLTTPIGAEGLDLVPGTHAEVVPLARFGEALAALLADPARRARLGAAGAAWARERFSPEELGRRVARLLGRPTAP